MVVVILDSCNLVAIPQPSSHRAQEYIVLMLIMLSNFVNINGLSQWVWLNLSGLSICHSLVIGQEYRSFGKCHYGGPVVLDHIKLKPLKPVREQTIESGAHELSVH